MTWHFWSSCGAWPDDFEAVLPDLSSTEYRAFIEHIKTCVTCKPLFERWQERHPLLEEIMGENDSEELPEQLMELDLSSLLTVLPARISRNNLPYLPRRQGKLIAPEEDIADLLEQLAS